MNEYCWKCGSKIRLNKCENCGEMAHWWILSCEKNKAKDARTLLEILLFVCIGVSFLGFMAFNQGQKQANEKKYEEGEKYGYSIAYEEAMDEIDKEKKSSYNYGYEVGYSSGYKDGESQSGIKYVEKVEYRNAYSYYSSNRYGIDDGVYDEIYELAYQDGYGDAVSDIRRDFDIDLDY